MLVLNAFQFGGIPAGYTYSHAMVTRITSDSDVSPMIYNNEVYDTGGYWDVSDPTKLVVPSGVTLVRLNAGQISPNSVGISFIKNGADFAGGIYFNHSFTDGADGVSATSAIIPVSAGDYFQVRLDNVRGGVDSHFSIESVDPATSYALVFMAADQALTASTETTVTFGAAASVDTDGYHDEVGAPTRLTVPSGVSKVKVSASIRDNNSSGASSSFQTILKLWHNGGETLPGLPGKEYERRASNNSLSVISAILDVTAGDYFEVRSFSTQGASLLAGNHTWFQIEEVDPATRYCLLQKANTQSIGATTVGVTFGAGSEVHDPEGMHDTTTNNTRIVVPAGATEARASFSLVRPSQTFQWIGRVYKNGSPAPGLPRQEVDSPGAETTSGQGAWIPVVPGDYFELMGYGDGSATVAISPLTWFQLEVR